ncbi:LOW QUALITY PROTEIN: cytochrome P450 2D28-like [Morus bassanus]
MSSQSNCHGHNCDSSYSQGDFGKYWIQSWEWFETEKRAIPQLKELQVTQVVSEMDDLVSQFDPISPLNRWPAKTKGDANATYDEDDLIQTIFDLFLAGTETTATTLRWALLYMVVYPAIQKKVKELDALLGCSCLICYEDRKKLLYTNAVIHKIQQYSNIILIALPRDSIEGHSCWDFLFQWHHVHMGELLTRMELFIVFSTLLQAFQLTLLEGVKEVNTKLVLGSTMKPPPY